jgi:DNA polymerase-3 subunit gamma/tau
VPGRSGPGPAAESPARPAPGPRRTLARSGGRSRARPPGGGRPVPGRRAWPPRSAPGGRRRPRPAPPGAGSPCGPSASPRRTARGPAPALPRPRPARPGTPATSARRPAGAAFAQRGDLGPDGDGQGDYGQDAQAEIDRAVNDHGREAQERPKHQPLLRAAPVAAQRPPAQPVDEQDRRHAQRPDDSPPCNPGPRIVTSLSSDRLPVESPPRLRKSHSARQLQASPGLVRTWQTMAGFVRFWRPLGFPSPTPGGCCCKKLARWTRRESRSRFAKAHIL